MSLELILGPMFAGKTSALQSIIRRHEALGLKYVAFKPQIDSRYGCSEFIFSHDMTKVAANSATFLLPQVNSTVYSVATLVVIEEGQFFNDLHAFVLKAVEVDGKHVVVAGLDGDRFRQPFGQLLSLVPLADKITKITALCKICGKGGKAIPGLFTYGTFHSNKTVRVGGSEMYMPVCREHYLELIYRQQQGPPDGSATTQEPSGDHPINCLLQQK